MQMNPFHSLSEENQDQIRKYLRFFRQKKEGILRAIQREINDIKAERVNEDVFTREDLLDLLEFLSDSVKSQVSGEIGNVVNMGALALSQLLESSQDKGVELLLETSSLENQVTLPPLLSLNPSPYPSLSRCWRQSTR